MDNNNQGSSELMMESDQNISSLSISALQPPAACSSANLPNLIEEEPCKYSRKEKPMNWRR
jgi:hypothetical protein